MLYMCVKIIIVYMIINMIIVITIIIIMKENQTCRVMFMKDLHSGKQ